MEVRVVDRSEHPPRPPGPLRAAARPLRPGPATRDYPCDIRRGARAKEPKNWPDNREGRGAGQFLTPPPPVNPAILMSERESYQVRDNQASSRLARRRVRRLRGVRITAGGLQVGRGGGGIRGTSEVRESQRDVSLRSSGESAVVSLHLDSHSCSYLSPIDGNTQTTRSTTRPI
jgi:hypothetical protein